MGVDVDAVRKKREEKQKSNDFLGFDPGDTVIGIVEPCRPEDSVPFLELVAHYGVGGENGMVICLDLDKNKVLADPRVEAYLVEAGVDIGGGCPVCEEISSGRIKNDAVAKRLKAGSKYLLNCIPVKFRLKSGQPWTPHSLAGTVQPMFVGYSIWDGIMDLFTSEGDVSDRNRMIHARVNRVGKGASDTKYTVQADSDTIRKPVVLDAALAAAVDAAIAPGGTGDLYKMVARMVKDRAAVQAKMSGIATSKGKGKDAEEPEEASAVDRPEGAPNCYAVDCAPADPECQACPFKEGCSEACGVDVPPDLTTTKAKPTAASAHHAAAKAKEGLATPTKTAPVAKATTAAKPKPAAKPPPEPEPEPEEPAAEEVPADDSAPIYASDATPGNWYQMDDGAVMSCVGPAPKGGGILFEDEEGNRKKLAADGVVTPVTTEAPAEEEPVAEEPAAEEEAAPAEEPAPAADDDLAALEELLAAKKAAPKPKTAAAKPAAAKPAATPASKPPVAAKPAPKAAPPARVPVKK